MKNEKIEKGLKNDPLNVLAEKLKVLTIVFSVLAALALLVSGIILDFPTNDIIIVVTFLSGMFLISTGLTIFTNKSVKGGTK